MIDRTDQPRIRFKRGSLHGKFLEIPSDGKWAAMHFHTTLRGTETYLLKIGTDGVAKYVFQSIALHEIT